MLRALVQGAWQLLDQLGRRFGVTPPATISSPSERAVTAALADASAPQPPGLCAAGLVAAATQGAGKIVYQRLEKVVLTDAVARTLFDDFAVHRRGPRREEEVGWVLLGVRQERDALALATLPAGTERRAGVAHVHFNSQAQAVASRIVRQWDKRLAILGVVHTHPGSLRHPSDGDYQGDSQWVGQLRGKEGVFGIGTADARAEERLLGAPPREPHRQALGELCFSWYALAERERSYRPLPVEIVLGPDLAKPLHPLWDVIEEHAEALERLCAQQAKANFEVLTRPDGKALALTLPLVEPGTALKVLLDRRETQYLVQERSGLTSVDPEEPRLDRAVYLILAELCGALGKKPRQREASYSV
jgi:proteasome lid subunit RPN8/RPN11